MGGDVSWHRGAVAAAAVGLPLPQPQSIPTATAVRATVLVAALQPSFTTSALSTSRFLLPGSSFLTAVARLLLEPPQQPMQLSSSVVLASFFLQPCPFFCFSSRRAFVALPSHFLRQHGCCSSSSRDMMVLQAAR